VVGIVAFGAVATPDSSEGLYSELIRTEALGLERKANSFQEMIFDMPKTDRVVLERLTADIEEAIAVARSMADRVPNKLEYAPSMTLFYEALNQWQVGVAAFRSGVLRVADNPTDAVSGLELTRSLVVLAAGDIIYKEFVIAVGQADIPRPVGDFPEVNFVPVSFDPSLLASLIVNAARQEESLLRIRVNTMISRISTDPEWALDIDENPFVPAANEIVVKVVVTNDGNTDSLGGDLRLRVNGSGTSVYDRTVQVPMLPAQEQRTIVFEGIPVKPGFSYQLVAEVTPQVGETTVDDNTKEVKFSVNAAASTTEAS